MESNGRVGWKQVMVWDGGAGQGNVHAVPWRAGPSMPRTPPYAARSHQHRLPPRNPAALFAVL